jgi:multidrug transporter EmrE-like cation transporter
MQHHVFLSYSHKDADLMRQVRDDLRAAGFAVWTDENLEPGTPLWKDSIEHAIEGARFLIVILSPDAKQSMWVKREIEYASAQNLPIYSLLSRGDEQNAIPFALIGSQYIDIRSDYQTGVTRLIETIRKVPGIAPPQPAKLVSRPVAKPQPDSAPAVGLTGLRPLTAWNPLDQFRLLWWLFIRPEHLAAYREQFGKDAEKRVVAWLASSLLWLPLFIPLIGASLNGVDVITPNPLGVVYPIWTGGVILAWLITGWFGYSEDSRAVGVAVGLVISVVSIVAGTVVLGVGGVEMTGVAVGVTVGAALGVVGVEMADVVGIVAGTVVLGVGGFVADRVVHGGAGVVALGATGGVAVVVAVVVGNNLKRQRSSLWSQVIVAALPLSYTALIWIYWLGGLGVFLM